MSAIEAASVKVATMADGTLRITCDIEPAHAQAAFALFGSPGTPMALVALKVGFEAHGLTTNAVEAQKPSDVSDKPKGGALAKLAGMWCNDPHFCAWLTKRGDYTEALTPDRAAEVIRSWCHIESRAELDSDDAAERRFQGLIRGPYMKHCMTTRETA